MATLYTTQRYDGSVYIRGLINYSTSQSNTAVTVTVSNLQEYNNAGGWDNDGWEFGYYTTNTGSQGNLSYTWNPGGYHYFGGETTTIYGTAKSQTFTRKTSAYTVTLVVRFRTYNGGWSGYYTGSVNISVPALASYAVTFNGNGATSGSTAGQTKYYGQNLTLRSNGFTRTGYTFIGWNTSSTATTASYANGATYTGNAALTLYAIWSKAGYDISYDLDGGTVEVANPSGYSIDTPTFTLNQPTKTGYRFVGWTGSNGSVPQKFVTIPVGSSGNKSFTANWITSTTTAIDFYRNTSASTECITFGGTSETSTNQIITLFPLQLEGGFYTIDSTLTTLVTNLGWTDVIE